MKRVLFLLIISFCSYCFIACSEKNNPLATQTSYMDSWPDTIFSSAIGVPPSDTTLPMSVRRAGAINHAKFKLLGNLGDSVKILKISGFYSVADLMQNNNLLKVRIENYLKSYFVIDLSYPDNEHVKVNGGIPTAGIKNIISGQ